MITIKSNVLVSFVVPAYNVEKYIPKTLNSLLSQTEKDFEIIIVDDGSTDNTYQVVKEILQNSGFQNYKILRKPNGGVSSARNVGIKEAKGKYIIFLDGDDYVAPELVEEVKNIVLKNDVDMLCWKFQCVDETEKPAEYQFEQEGLKEGQIYTGLQVLERILTERSFWIWTGSAAYLREPIIRNGLFYNEKHHVGEDQEFIYKYLGNSYRIYFIGEVLSYYVQRSGSDTKKIDVKQFDSYLAIMEAQNYLSQKLDVWQDKVSKLLKVLEERAILDFLMWLRKHSSALKWPSYRKIVEIINTRHPNLLKYVLFKTRTHGKMIMKVKLLGRIGFEIFKFSPRAYVWLSWILGKVRKKLSKT